LTHTVKVIISDEFGGEKRILQQHSEIIFNKEEVENKLFRILINCQEYFEDFFK